MAKIAIKYTLDIPDRDWHTLKRYFKKTGQIKTESDLRNVIKQVAESYGYQSIMDCVNDGLNWLEENDPSWKITKAIIDEWYKDTKMMVNPNAKQKEMLNYWKEKK